MPKYNVILLAELSSDSPLAVGYLKAYAEADKRVSKKVSISIVQVDDLASSESALKHSPDLIGISCCGDTTQVRKVCLRLKSLNKKLRIVVGGITLSASEAAELLTCGAVDFVVLGEGERTFTDLLLFLTGRPAAIPEFPGLTFLHKGKVVQNPPRPPIEDLDSIPSPYLKGIFEVKGKTHLVQCSRGCVWSCRYCVENSSRKVRRFSEERVLQEVKYILARAPEARIVLIDADFFLDRARAKSLLKSFKAMGEGRRTLFSFTSNPYSWDEELTAAMACDNFRLSIGVQSMTPQALALSNRPTNVERIKENILRLKRLAPESKSSLDLIWGLPGDNLKGSCDALEWALNTGANEINLNRLRVFPCTHFGANKERFGIVCEDRYPFLVLSNNTFSAKDVSSMEKLQARMNFVLDFLLFEPFARSCLLYLGAILRGKLTHPSIQVSCEFTDFIREKSGLPSHSAVYEWFAARDKQNNETNPRDASDTLDLLAAFGCKLLKKHGLTGKCTALKRAVSAAKGRRLFIETAALRAKIAGTITAASPKNPASTLLVCWEDAKDQICIPCTDIALLRDTFTDSSSGYRKEQLSKKVFRLGNAEESLRDLVPGAGACYDTVILSGVYGSLSKAQRAEIFKLLGKSLKPGGRILIFDDLLGSPDPVLARGAETEKAVETELKANGLKPGCRPMKLLNPGLPEKYQFPVWFFLGIPA